jgi:excinuclease ABC subunit A
MQPTFFSAIPVIKRKLDTLLDVGLSYIKLGTKRDHPVRRRGATHQAGTRVVKTRYGSHPVRAGRAHNRIAFHDIRQLLKVLHRLRDHGNTVVVIEHNLDVIKTADWLIDLGPEGGDGGGEVVATGTPEQIAQNTRSHTGRYLAPLLQRRPHMWMPPDTGTVEGGNLLSRGNRCTLP